MAVLSDVGIRQAVNNGLMAITPLQDQDIQPASVDVHLGNTLRVPKTGRVYAYDPSDPPKKDDYELVYLGSDPYYLQFGGFVLGSTLEYITLGAKLTAHIDGISSLGRLGLVIHSGSCWIDPGFTGTVTLEMSVGSHVPVVLRKGMRIGQLVIEQVDPPVGRLYGSDELESKYQGQILPGRPK